MEEMSEKERKKRILDQEISNLESQLLATDYQVIKTYEARIQNDKDPYDTEALLQSRQKIRNQINEKQKQMVALESLENNGTASNN